MCKKNKPQTLNSEYLSILPRHVILKFKVQKPSLKVRIDENDNCEIHWHTPNTSNLGV